MPPFFAQKIYNLFPPCAITWAQHVTLPRKKGVDGGKRRSLTWVALPAG
jgi:hypothetical protein